jgi:anion-transporting  ArsA/GET3 family ATPase
VTTRILLVTGAGGVGKTTISAAAGVTSARRGVATLVVTVDPAKRLADALGVGSLGNLPTQVTGEANLWAAMLDVAASWEAIVARHAAPEVGDKLLANPYFRAIADRFPAAQAYAAGEQMAEFVESGAWDLVIVDTPPSVGGIDFLLAPGQARDLIGGKLLRWLTGAKVPARRALYRVTARPVLRLADLVLGGPLLEEIADFLLDLRTLYDGVEQRAKGVERHLRSARTVVVTNAYPTPMREARRFFEELPDGSVVPTAVVFNRELPHEWELLSSVPANGSDLDQRSWTALRDNVLRWATEARRNADARADFAARYGATLASTPWKPQPPTDLDALADLVATSNGLDEALFA